MSGHMLRLVNVTEFAGIVTIEKNCGTTVVIPRSGKMFIKVKSLWTLIKNGKKERGTEAVVVNALV